MTVAMTLILTVGALLGIEGLLYILDTPADIMEEALQYIRIIIMGTAFISLYNYSANILRAVGESRIPLVCLAVAVILYIFHGTSRCSACDQYCPVYCRSSVYGILAF